MVHLRPCGVLATLPVLFLFCTALAQPQQQQQQQRPPVTCKLTLQGGSLAEVTAAAAAPVTSATLNCIAPPGVLPISVGINGTYLSQHAVQFSGVTVVPGLACQQAAEAAVGRVPVYSLLYFCGSYSVMFDAPVVRNIQLEHDSLHWRTALLYFGDSVNVTVHNGQLSGNSATYITYLQNSASMLVESSTFSYNQARLGTIRLEGSASARIINSTFSSNIASSTHQQVSSAGVSLVGEHTSLTVRTSTFQGGVVRTGIPGAPADGGACDVSGKTNQVVFEDSTISNNSASRLGGGIAFFSSGSLTIVSTNLTDNTATSGGAVYGQESGMINIAGSRLEGNRAAADSINSALGCGGALHVLSDVKVAIRNSSLANNTADGQGGAIWATISANITLHNSSCSSNTAGSAGGCAFLQEQSELQFVESSSLKWNQAPVGAGLQLIDNASMALQDNSTIVQNVASSNGGGVSMGDNARVVVAAGCICNNTAEANGGGIFLSGFSKLNLSSDAQISNNTAHWGGGVSFGSRNTFDVATWKRSVVNNTATFDSDVSVAPSNLSVIGDTIISDFVSRSDIEDSVLPVALQVLGQHGLPCQGFIVQAVLNGTRILGVDRSDSNGMLHMRLPIRQPPGSMSIMFSLLPSSGQEALQQVQPVNVSLTVRACIPGEVAPSPDICQACQPDTFSLDPRNRTCDDCPELAACPGGVTIVPQLGAWHSTPKSPQVHGCPNPAACQGNRTTLAACSLNITCSSDFASYAQLQCSTGYEGNLCGVCAANYGSARPFTCRTCMGRATMIGLYLAAAVVLLSFIKLLCHYTLADNYAQTSAMLAEQASAVPTGHHKARSTVAPGTRNVPVSELIRPLVLYMQYMLVIIRLGVGSWPAPLAYPFTALAWVWAPASPETLSVDCLLSGRSSSLSVAIQKLLFYLFMPFAMLLILLVAEGTIMQLTRSRSTRAASMRHRLASDAMVVAYFFTPAIMRIVFSLFACIPIDKPAPALYYAAAVGKFWVHDTDQACFAGYHRVWALALGVPLLLLVCGVMPAVILWKTLGNKHKLADTGFIKQNGFLYRSYKPAYCYWEAVVLWQTAVLVAIGVFQYNLGNIRSIAMYISLAIIGVMLHTIQPYAHAQAGRIMLQGVVCLFLTTTGSMTMAATKDDSEGGLYDLIMAILLLALNVAYVASVVYRIAKAVQWRHIWVEANAVAHRVASSFSQQLLAHGNGKAGSKTSSGAGSSAVQLAGLQQLHSRYPAGPMPETVPSNQ